MHALTIYQRFLFKNLNIKFKINILVILIKDKRDMYGVIFHVNKSNSVNKEQEETEKNPPGSTRSRWQRNHVMIPAEVTHQASEKPEAPTSRLTWTSEWPGHLSGRARTSWPALGVSVLFTEGIQQKRTPWRHGRVYLSSPSGRTESRSQQKRESLGEIGTWTDGK